MKIKKIILAFAMIFVFTIVAFFVKPMDIGGGWIPPEYTTRCLGFFLLQKDDRPIDGGAYGLCFGIVKKELNPGYNIFREQNSGLFKN